MTFFAGVPVGFAVEGVPCSSQRVFTRRLERDLLLSRLRWFVLQPGLVLDDARIGNLSLVDGYEHALALSGEGCWRFAPVRAPCGTLVQVHVQNLWGGPITPHALAFWGTPVK